MKLHYLEASTSSQRAVDNDEDNFNTPLVKKKKMNHADTSTTQHNESEGERNIVNKT